MKKRYLFLLLAALLCTACIVGASAAAEITYTDQFSNPVVNGADPFAFYDDGTYYLYATNDGSYGYIYADLGLTMYRPEDSTGYDTEVWLGFFGTEIVSLVTIKVKKLKGERADAAFGKSEGNIGENQGGEVLRGAEEDCAEADSALPY